MKGGKGVRRESRGFGVEGGEIKGSGEGGNGRRGRRVLGGKS